MSFLVSDWATLARTLVVGVLAYVALVAVLRLSGKRTLSQMNAFDFVVTVALGSTLATILLSRDVSLAEGVFAIVVLVAMQFVITWTSVRSPLVARLAKSEPTPLVYRGRLLRDAMRRERVLEAELRSVLRGHGIASIDGVDLVVLETDGTFSVVGSLPPGDATGLVRRIPPSSDSPG